MNIVSVGLMASNVAHRPPLTVTREEIDRGIAIARSAIGDVLGAGCARGGGVRGALGRPVSAGLKRSRRRQEFGDLRRVP